MKDSSSHKNPFQTPPNEQLPENISAGHKENLAAEKKQSRHIRRDYFLIELMIQGIACSLFILCCIEIFLSYIITTAPPHPMFMYWSVPFHFYAAKKLFELNPLGRITLYIHSLGLILFWLYGLVSDSFIVTKGDTMITVFTLFCAIVISTKWVNHIFSEQYQSIIKQTPDFEYEKLRKLKIWSDQPHSNQEKNGK